jgi:hypothetical protein
MNRWTKISALLVVTCLALPALGEAASKSRPMCGPRDAKTVLKDEGGRVYSIRSGGMRTVYACLYGGTPRRLRLPRPEPGSGPFIRESVYDVDLNASWVAYSWEFEGFDSGKTGVSSLNLKTGRVGRVGWALRQSTRAAWTTITDLELKRNGSVAWIADGRGSGGGEGPVVEREVGVSDRFGPMILENSLGVSPRSLRLSGSEVRWLASGFLHIATLH